MQNMPMTDIIAMMKKQGINMDGFEAEAEDIWKSLDDMSAKDPDEYRKFIQNQYEESQEEDSKSSGTASSSSETKSATEERFFRPTAGFSMKTKTSGGDGIKIRGDGDGKVLYLNFCSHPAIEAPLDRNGRPADTKDSYRLVTMDGLQVI